MKRKEKLFITFVDYTKAYDKIPRQDLLNVLKSLGCGHKMLAAIAAMYSATKSVLSSTTINSNIGLMQGCFTSNVLFTIYLNELPKLYRSECTNDGFLEWLHTILLMDDAAIFATNRDRFIEKFLIMIQFCRKYCMEINYSKTMFMVVNGTTEDKADLHIHGNTVKHCIRYIYLGAIILEDTVFSRFIEAQLQEKNKNLVKFYSFLCKNPDLPFRIKCVVLEACLFAILYSCESWFSEKYLKLNSMYMAALKGLLGVRESCPNYVCLIESGYSGLKARIKEKQFKFFHKLTVARSQMSDDPFMHMLAVARKNGASSAKYIDGILEQRTESFISKDAEMMRSKILGETGSKFQMYCRINRNLENHEIYCNKYVTEDHRITFTRLKTSCHRLRIETGR